MIEQPPIENGIFPETQYPSKLVIGFLKQSEEKVIVLNNDLFDTEKSSLPAYISSALENSLLPENYRPYLQSASDILKSDQKEEWLNIYKEIATEFMTDQWIQFEEEKLGDTFQLIDNDISPNNYIRLTVVSKLRSTFASYNQTLRIHPERSEWIQQMLLLSVHSSLIEKGKEDEPYNQLLMRFLPNLTLFNGLDIIEPLLMLPSDIDDWVNDSLPRKSKLIEQYTNTMDEMIADEDPFIDKVITIKNLIYTSNLLLNLRNNLRNQLKKNRR